MTLAKDTEQLLATEQAVQQLLKELEGLMRQVGGYDNAKQSLEEVRQALKGLIDRTSNLAEQTHSATSSLGKIGTPEILARVDNTRSEITQSVEAHVGKVGGGIEASTKAVVGAIRELAMRSEEVRKTQEAEAVRRSQQMKTLLILTASLAGLSLVGAAACVVILLLRG